MVELSIWWVIFLSTLSSYWVYPYLRCTPPAQHPHMRSYTPYPTEVVSLHPQGVRICTSDYCKPSPLPIPTVPTKIWYGITMKTYHNQNFIRTKSSLPSPYSGKISCIWIHHLRHWIIIIVKSNLAHNQLCLSAVWRLGMYGYYPTDAWGKYFLCWERLVPVCYAPQKY